MLRSPRLDKFIFYGTLMTKAKFSDGGVERLSNDLSILFGVFGGVRGCRPPLFTIRTKRTSQLLWDNNHEQSPSGELIRTDSKGRSGISHYLFFFLLTTMVTFLNSLKSTDRLLQS